MSQGFVFTPENEEAIYATSDTCVNPPPPKDKPIDKLILFNNNKRLLLTTGGLDHWTEARTGDMPVGTVKEIAEEFKERLDQVMTPANRAFGLICGYDDGKAVCYYVGRKVGEQECTVEERDLHVVQPIGVVGVEAGKKANDEIKAGRPPMQALEEAIKAASALSPTTISGLKTAKISKE